MEITNKQNTNQDEFIRYNSFDYRFDVVEFPESLKVAGVPAYHGGISDFVGMYYKKYDLLMQNSDYTYEPYTVMCVWSSLLGEQRKNSWESGDRIWGCFVKSLDNLPEGLIGADLKLKKFLVMTVRDSSVENTNVVSHPVDNFRELMPKEFINAIYPPIQEVNWHFQIDGDETFYMSYLEIDREINTNSDNVIYEKKLYAPLKSIKL